MSRASGDQNDSLNVKKDFTHFSPRTGLSWRVNERTVVRAGYGASTLPYPDNRYAFNYPVKQNYQGSAANGFQAAGSMAQGFPDPALLTIPSNGVIPVSGALRNATFDVIPTGLHEATLHSWNVAFQRQLPYALTAEAAYVGNRGIDIVMDLDTNASRIYGSGNAGQPQFAPFNRTATNRTRTNDGKTDYHALQVKVDRRFRNGLLLNNSYTLGRARDYVNENTTISTPLDFEQSYGRSNFDRKHMYVLNAIYELPWGPGKKWLSDGLAGKIIGGWQVSGLFIAQSGSPSTSPATTRCSTRPARLRIRTRTANTACSAASGPASCTSIRRSTHSPPTACRATWAATADPTGPGFWSLDAALFKRFGVGGHRYAEFRD